MDEELKIDDDDFGFGMSFDEPGQNVERKIRETVMPLLLNLLKNPQSETIRWPGDQRVKSIRELVIKINRIAGHPDNYGLSTKGLLTE